MAEQVIAGASVLLSTSDAEGFPNTFLQAWAAGTPVLSLGVDPDGIIERAGLGIVSRGVENAVADIRALVGSPQSRQEMGLRARCHVAQTHSEESIVAAFERVVGCAGTMNRRQALSVLENPR
jgi:glycosyltransferase involved in cell wall biosynthesis